MAVQELNGIQEEGINGFALDKMIVLQSQNDHGHMDGLNTETSNIFTTVAPKPVNSSAGDTIRGTFRKSNFLKEGNTQQMIKNLMREVEKLKKENEALKM